MARKLKPLSHYRKRGNGTQKPQEMLAALKAFQAKGANMTIKRIRMEDR